MAVILHLPSCEGHGEYDRFVKAPEGMSEEEAVRIVETEIKRANQEDARNCEGTGDGGCDDGLSVEESIKAGIAKLGLEFFKPTMTSMCWDQNF